MLKKIHHIGFTVLFTMLTLIKLTAQDNIVLMATVPSGNSMHYEDIWNLTVFLNSPPPAAYYFLEIEVTESPEITLWKAKTYTFRIAQSPFTISPVNIQLFDPVNVYFIEPGWEKKMTRGGGLFPPGEYKITYRLIQTTEGCTTAGLLAATTVIYKSINTLFPPSLLFPFNNDSLDNENPVFAWAPVFPASQNDIVYQVRIAEIAGTQNPEQAIANNRLFLNYDARDQLTAIYPPQNMPLRKGQTYAWQVTAKNKFGVMGYSETWKFTVAGDEKKELPSLVPPVFITIRKALEGPVYQVNGNFLFTRYEAPYPDAGNGLDYELINSETQEKIITGKIMPLSEEKGLNTYALDITSLKTGQYIVKVIDEKGNTGFVVFARSIRK